MVAPNRELLLDNPLSKIPTLALDDGRVLIDSGLICEYFDALAGGGRLIPTGEARWMELSRHAMATGMLDILILWRNERDKPPATQTPAWLASFETKARASLDRLQRDVEPIGDETLRLSQIALGCSLSYLDFRFAALDWRAAHPALAAWHETFKARPSAQKTEIVDDS